MEGRKREADKGPCRRPRSGSGARFPKEKKGETSKAIATVRPSSFILLITSSLSEGRTQKKKREKKRGEKVRRTGSCPFPQPAYLRRRAGLDRGVGT